VIPEFLEAKEFNIDDSLTSYEDEHNKLKSELN